jgi:hypothetical protein
LLRILAILFGSALVCLRFLYEDEEKRLQSTLEDWWLRLAYQSDQAFSREARFLRGVASSTSRFLSKILGDATLSLRSISVSITWSTIPPLLVTTAAFYLLSRLSPGDQTVNSDPSLQQMLPAVQGIPLYLKTAPAGIALGLITAIVVSSLYPRARWLYVTSALACLAIIADLLITLRGVGGSLYTLALAFPITVLCQCYAISVTRRVLTRSASSSSAAFICTLLFLNLLTLALLVIAPFVLTLLTAIPFLSGVWVENVSCSAILVLSTLFAFMMLLHRLLWPLVLRPLYFLQRHRVLEHKGLFVGAGISLLVGTFWTWKDLWVAVGGLLERTLTQ